MGCYIDELHDVISRDSLDFDEWASLISEVEKRYPDDVDKICQVYDSFLSKFPLCFGYWRKYAKHMTRLCTVDKVVDIFEQAVQSVTYSVSVWVDYCSFGMLAFEDPSDIRRLFKRAIYFIGKDYLCHTLWDKYIEFELSQQQWSSLAHIYIQILKFPKKKLEKYYDGFKKVVAFLKKGLVCQSNSTLNFQSEQWSDDEVPLCYKDEDITCIIEHILDPSVGLNCSKSLQKYMTIGYRFYQDTCKLDEKIQHFEANIRRPYFHVRPLDVNQLENWHQYLDFVERQGDFDWAVKLYERCLIVCANYPEYWMRYVDFIEAKGGRELANYALDRSTKVFLKKVPAIHQFNARFKEQIGDVDAARAAFIHCIADSDSNFIENVTLKANMEKRLGNAVEAFNIFKEAIEIAVSKKMLHMVPILYVHLSRLKYMCTCSADAARDILIDGIKSLPPCKLLLEELVKFSMMHGCTSQIDIVDSVVSDVIFSDPGGSQGLNVKDVEDLSRLYLEFVDLCGTVQDVRKAWHRHMKFFPQTLRRDPVYISTGRGGEISIIPPEPSSNCNSGLAQLQSQERKQSPLENHDTQSQQVHSTSNMISEPCLPSMENQDGKYDESMTFKLHVKGVDDSRPENGTESSAKFSEELKNETPEQDLSSVGMGKEKEASLKVSEVPMEGTCEPDVSLKNADCQTASDIEFLPVSRENLEANDAYGERKHGYGSEEVKPPEIGSLSLSPRGSVYPDSILRMADKHRASQETSNSNRRSPGSDYIANQEHALGTQGSQSTQNDVEMNIRSSSMHHQSHIPESCSQPRSFGNRSRNWDRCNAGKHRRESIGYRGHSNREQHQVQVSPQQHHYSERSPSVPIARVCHSQLVSSERSHVQQGNQEQSQCHPSAPHDPTATHARPMQNVQEQNSSSQSQELGPNASSQIGEHAIQGYGQYGYMPNGQPYDQMWQYYYYYYQQQQQQQWQLQQQHIPQNEQPQLHMLLQQQQYQQQQLQMQQHYMQLQQQQYYQQQQQQSYQQEQSDQQQNLSCIQQQLQPQAGEEQEQHKESLTSPPGQSSDGSYSQQDCK